MAARPMEESGEEPETRVGDLPESCLAQAIALTSPRDAARCAAVSPSFHAAAESDAVWARFLPPDYRAILASAVPPSRSPPACSKKELYLSLSDRAVLVDSGKMVVWLEKESGGKCYGLSARKLSLPWEDGEFSWRWTPHPNSRFGEVAQLLECTSLDIYARLSTSVLTPGTSYAIYLVFDTAEGHRGLSFADQETTVVVNNHVVSRHVVCLCPDGDMAHKFRGVSLGDNRDGSEFRQPTRRNDGWWEVEMGQLQDNEATLAIAEDVVASFEVMGWYPKRGLLVESVEFRPVQTSDSTAH